MKIYNFSSYNKCDFPRWCDQSKLSNLGLEFKIAVDVEASPAAPVEVHEGDPGIVNRVSMLNLVLGQDQENALGVGGERRQDVVD